MRDTTEDAAEAQFAAFRRMSPAERVALAFEASDWLMAVARARQSAAGDGGSGARAEAESLDALPATRALRDP